MKSNSYAELIELLRPAVIEAGAKILEVYELDPDADFKGDGSPVTEADRAAEAILNPALEKHEPDVVVISEENAASHSIAPPAQFFLVDPLDGTREFIKRDGKGSFTVNIALIENGEPVMGIVYAPALKRMFTGAVGHGATEDGQQISVRQVPDCGYTAVASASHRDAETDKWLAQFNVKDIASIGSSLKFCLMAAGEADVYPRFGPTMEWDTAAGHAILSAAGGTVTHPDGAPFNYGKTDYRNGPFIAHSGCLD